MQFSSTLSYAFLLLNSLNLQTSSANDLGSLFLSATVTTSTHESNSQGAPPIDFVVKIDTILGAMDYSEPPIQNEVEFWPGHTSAVLDSGCWVGLYASIPSLDTSIYKGVVKFPMQDVPHTSTVPIRWYDLPSCDRKTTYKNRFSMDSKVREDYVIVVFRGGYKNPKEIGRSKVITVLDKDAPGHVRITRLGKEESDGFKVLWNSKNHEIEQYLEISKTSDNFDMRIASEFYQDKPTKHNFPDVPAKNSGFVDLGYTMYVDVSTKVFEQMGQDESETIYYYRVGSDETGWSNLFSFRFSFAPSTMEETSLVILSADIGLKYQDDSHYHWMEPSSLNTTSHIARLYAQNKKADLMFIPGDISYSTGFMSKWDMFMTQIENIGAYIPLLTGKGNHEQDCEGRPFNVSDDFENSFYVKNDSGGECGIATDYLFHMPIASSANSGNEKVTQNQGYYSINQGPVHYIMLNNEIPNDPTSKLYLWLEEDFKSVDRKNTPWLVVMGHRPMYGDKGLEANTKQLEGLFVEYKVDLAVWGHCHFAERTCPVIDGICITDTDEFNYDAPIHIVVGNGGQSLSKLMDKRVYDESLIWEYGFTTLEANKYEMVITFFGDSVGDVDPRVIDSHIIKRAYPRI